MRHRAEWLVLAHSPTLALTHALTHAHACALLLSLAQAWAAAFSFMKDRHLDVAHSGDAGAGESDDDTNEPPAVRGEQKCVPPLGCSVPCARLSSTLRAVYCVL